VTGSIVFAIGHCETAKEERFGKSPAISELFERVENYQRLIK
jgi:hypothetical protein